jgi:hypothetical protein
MGVVALQSMTDEEFGYKVLTMLSRDSTDEFGA